MIRDNQYKYDSFRSQYNVFTFERFDYVINNEKLKVKYFFNLSDKVNFYPEFTITFFKQKPVNIPTHLIRNLIFQVGMVELISYWKAACAPLVIIKPFKLSSDQIQFWKKLYFHGLGEFFYLNGINGDKEDFMTIQCQGKEKLVRGDVINSPEKVLVPVGGGKDSVVTLELLRNKFIVTPFTVNPRKATKETVRLAGYNESSEIKVVRKIHPQLLQLNEEGFLNGHTPFSALIAFMSLLTATLSGIKYIALSNESSANEPTVINGPNHQYSKSIEFEADFRAYVNATITSNVEYFSFLRPLSEYRIAGLFSRFPKHYFSFRSCNVGSKTDTWCGNCPKCLFTAIILSPYLDVETIHKIVGVDILNNRDHIPILNELCGIAEVKPFECVGTVDEVNLALVELIKKTKSGDYPALIEYYMGTEKYQYYKNAIVKKELNLDSNHFLPAEFIDLLMNTG